MKDEVFSFCIGTYYPKSKTVNTHTYGTTVFIGNIEKAKQIQELLSEKAKKKLEIFKLVKI